MVSFSKGCCFDVSSFTFIFLEETKKSASVVRPVRNDSHDGRSIRTGWSLMSKEKEQRCELGCLTWAGLHQLVHEK